jgi:CRISPR/Cas system endoribonuclease Cas6 (RAMP superfamily)
MLTSLVLTLRPLHALPRPAHLGRSVHALPFKEGGLKVGFTGDCHFIALRRDHRQWLRVLHLLAAFALYAGVGAHTAMGLGQARVMEGD